METNKRKSSTPRLVTVLPGWTIKNYPSYRGVSGNSGLVPYYNLRLVPPSKDYLESQAKATGPGAAYVQPTQDASLSPVPLLFSPTAQRGGGGVRRDMEHGMKQQQKEQMECVGSEDCC